MPLQPDLRSDLAAAFRLAAHYEFNEGICNHFSVALPEGPELYLINPYGVHWSEMRPSNIVLVDLDGNVVEGQGSGAITAMQIHRQIHRARPDARCIMHTHMPYASAVACTKGGFNERLKAPPWQARSLPHDPAGVTAR